MGLGTSCRKIHSAFGIDVNLVSARFIKGAVQKSFNFLKTSLQNLEYEFIHVPDNSPLSLKVDHLKNVLRFILNLVVPILCSNS